RGGRELGRHADARGNDCGRLLRSLFAAWGERVVTTRAGLISALADLRVGRLFPLADEEEVAQSLHDLAAAAPEFFAAERGASLTAPSRLSASESPAGLQYLVLVSQRHVHIVLRSSRKPFLALVGLAPHTRNVGLILSEARARLRQVEDQQ